MKLKQNWLVTAVLLLLTVFSFAQEKTITGNITDQDGLPLPGVSVVVEQTNSGAQTDFDGNYAISASEGQVLRFSYVGQKTVSLKVGSSNVMNVQMEEDAQTLDEVVVVAYGTQKKEAIVGSVVSIDSEIISKQQVTNVTSAIQGNVPGVNVVTSGGVPGTSPTIRIRGVGSINASADPLIIVDGAPYNGNLNNISQDQIETINVLKDASSTALYGSRAANGVIVITTKTGKVNSEAQLTFNTSYGVSDNAVAFHDLVRAGDYMRYSWEAMRNSSQYVNGNDRITAGEIASNNLITELGYNPYSVSNPIDANGNVVAGANLMWDTDWANALIRPSGSRTEHGVTLTGGSEKTTYFASANYLNEQGNVRTTKFGRVTSRVKVDSQVKDWLKVGFNLGYTASSSNVPTQSGSSFQSAVQWFYSVPSIYPVYQRDEAGNLIYDANGQTVFDYGDNPNGQSVNGNRSRFSGENGVGALYNYDLKIKRYNTTLSGYGEIAFTDNFKFRSSISYENYILNDYSYISNEFGYAANVDGRVTQNRDITTTINAIQSFNYRNTFGAHSVGADVIYEAYSLELDELGAQGVGYLPNVKVLDGSTTPENVSGAFTDETLNSFLGRLSYDYDGKYFIEGSYRKDGSSRFGEDVRWGDFYAFGGSWIVSRENFLIDSNVINLLKFKGSYGELGNNRGIGYFPYLSVFETGWNQLENPGVIKGDAVDPNLTWEKTASLNAGVEFGLFQNAISGSVEYYERESVDLIYDRPLPISTGNSSIKTNVGSLKNSGVEVTLSSKIFDTTDFQWNAGINFSFDKNEITELPVDEFINGTKKWEVGRSLYEFFTFEYAGVDPEDGYAMWYTDVLDETTGEPTGERETTKVYSEATRYYVGKSSLPKVIGGFNTNLTYKNWDFSGLVNFSFGSYIMDGTYQGLMSSLESLGSQVHADIANRWQQPGDVTDVPLLLNSNNDFNSTSTRFLFKNDYVRIRALNLGYSLSKDVLERIGMSKIRLYVQADNPFTFQSHKGIDPEQNLAGTTDSRSYQLRTVSFGINAQF